MSSISDSVFDKGAFSGAKLVFCERFTERSDIWNLARHEHSYLELIYFLEGGARVYGESDDLILSIYDLVIYPEYFPHKESVDLSHHQEIVCLGIELPDPSGLDRIWRLSDIESQLRWLFVEIHAQALSEYPDKNILLDNLVNTLLHYIKQQMDGPGEIQDPIRRVILFLHENLSRKISIEELASLANCSPSYLDRRFKERTGSTPIRYLDAIRLEAASRFLARSDVDIGQLASLIGFDDPKYFSRRFSARYGMPPSRFRTEALGFNQ
jgi:AraC-like DNA-binding protein